MRSPAFRFLMGTLLGATALLAMEPPDPGMIKAYRKDGTLQKRVTFAQSIGNHKVTNGLAQRMTTKLRNITGNQVHPEPPPAWKDMPTTGSVKVLTICIDFSDYPHNNEKNSILQMNDRIFDDGDDQVAAPYESFKAFYKRSSYDKLQFSGQALGWYRATSKRDDMAQTTSGREALIKEALAYFNGGAGGNHDFSQYDNNGDGAIDFFSVIWTGPDNGWANFWWGYQTSFTDESFTVDGKTLGKYSWQWESRYRDASNNLHYDGPFSPKTLIHEQGHGLGLPDYYDYDDAVGPRGGVGGLDMMDWVGDHNCFSKWLLDWITPTVVNTLTDTGVKTLRDQSTNEDALVVMPGIASGDFVSGGKSAPFGEFFMVQNRQLTGNDLNRDLYIDGSGLLVWHVDSRLDASNFDYQYENSWADHKLLRLMEADGLEDIETNAADADAGDFYDGTEVIGTTTTPNTSRYDGTWTNFQIASQSASGASMNVNITTVAGDTTAPTGVPTRPTGAVNVDAVQFTWTRGTAYDSNGSIIGYYLQVGSTSGGSDVFDGRVGNVLTKTLTGMGIWDGKPLYARVRAMNTAGLYTSWSTVSAPVTITLPAFSLGCSTLDNCELTFKSVASSVGPWSADTSTSVQGASSAMAECLDNEQTYIQTKITGPGKLTFQWKASTEKDFDYYSVLLDGEVDTRISGDVDWTEKTVTIPAGDHVVTWIWAKDGNTGGTQDKVWLDYVQFQDWDVNADGEAGNILDLGWMVWANGSDDDPDFNWIAAADLDGDGDVDDTDLSLFQTATGF